MTPSVVAEHIVRELQPVRVLDAGCRRGLLVESLRDRGVDAWGMDPSPGEIAEVRADIRPYCRVGSIIEPIEGRFDLITCIEELERLPASESRLAVERLTGAADALLFSLTPGDPDEPVRGMILSWLKLFSEHHFAPDTAFDASFIASHAFLLRRSQQVVADSVLNLFSEKLQLQSNLRRREFEIAQLKRGDATGLWRLQNEVILARKEISQVYGSPAWSLISRYRAWLKGHQLRGSPIWRIYEPMALLALRMAGARRARVSNNSPVTDDSASYREWYLRVEPSELELDRQRARAAELAYRPLMSVLVPVFRVPLEVVEAMVESVVNQTYDHWELCIAHADPEDTAVRAYLASVSAREPRVKLELLAENRGISGNSNAALSLVNGEFVALLDHDDTLAPFALFEIARALCDDPTLDLIYSDKDQIDTSGGRLQPLFKPDWSPELMLSANYLTHLTVMRTERMRAIGGWRPETDGAQDWDLFLRFINSHSRVGHIPMALYHWRRLDTSVAARGFEAKPYAVEAQLLTLRDHLSRTGMYAGIEAAGGGMLRLTWEQPIPMPVSLIVVQQSEIRETIAFASRALRAASSDVLEIVIASSDATTVTDSRIRLVSVDPSQPLAARLNLAADRSRGGALIFLDENVNVQGESWDRELTGPLQYQEIGMVGAKLLDAQTGLTRHAGFVFSADGELQSVFAGESEEYHSAFGDVCWYRNWSAVSGACFSIRRDVFVQAGRFAERPDYPRLDVDLCLRVRLQTGRRILHNPFARMLQRQTGGLEEWLDARMSFAGAVFIRRCFPNGDPYFNPNLVCLDGKVALKLQRQTSAEPDNPYSIEARTLVNEYDFTETILAASRAACSQPAQHRLQTIAWFLPDISNPFYGGIHTILRFAEYFRSAHGVRNTFVMVARDSGEDLKATIGRAFPELAACSMVTKIPTMSQAAALQPCDAAVASLWKTAFPVLAFNRTRRKFYFLQDYEAAFYPAGSSSALAESSYQFGFIGICNTMALRDKYHEHGGEAEFFNPCVDSSIFHVDGRAPELQGRHTVFFYGRPEHPRNCFELIAAAMSILKRRFGNRVRILAAGAGWSVDSHGLKGIVENLGVLDYRQTGALYRTCDVGVALTMTSHPSYLPLELMACGALVVSNRNPRTAWFLKDRVNCLLAAGSASAIADRIEEGLLNSDLRNSITQRAADMIAQEYSQWEAQAEKIYWRMLELC